MVRTILDKKSGKAPPWCAIQTAAYTLLDVECEFYEEHHLYFFNGIPIPSVTEILDNLGFIDTTWFKDYNRELGNNVHLITHLDDIDDLEEETVGEVEKPYLEAWRKFKRESGFIVEQSEVPMASSKYLFAGRPDLTGYFPSGIIKRAVIELHNDGKYKLIPHTDRQEVNIWLSALACYQWKANNLRRK